MVLRAPPAGMAPPGWGGVPEQLVLCLAPVAVFSFFYLLPFLTLFPQWPSDRSGMALLGERGHVEGLADAPRPWNVSMRECQLCVRFLSKALKIKLPCLNIYF